MNNGVSESSGCMSNASVSLICRESATQSNTIELIQAKQNMENRREVRRKNSNILLRFSFWTQNRDSAIIHCLLSGTRPSGTLGPVNNAPPPLPAPSLVEVVGYSLTITVIIKAHISKI